MSRARPSTFPVTPREREVLTLVAHGLSNREVGEHLHLSEETVKTHLKRVYMKTGARNRAHAVALHLTGKT